MTPEAPLTCRAASLSSRGPARAINEDAVRIAWILDREVPELLAVVANGTGEGMTGELASSLAVETVETSYAAAGDWSAATLRAAIDRASDAMLRAAARDARFETMGVACTAVAVRAGRAVWAHAADSRLYLVRRGAIRALTVDEPRMDEPLSLERGDRLLLCTDGLYAAGSDEDLATIVSTTDDPEEACRALIAHVRASGATDDVTVVVVVVL